jgi:hypothetical protein
MQADRQDESQLVFASTYSDILVCSSIVLRTRCIPNYSRRWAIYHYDKLTGAKEDVLVESRYGFKMSSFQPFPPQTLWSPEDLSTTRLFGVFSQLSPCIA